MLSAPPTNWALPPSRCIRMRTATRRTDWPTRPIRSARPVIRCGPTCRWTRSSRPRATPALMRFTLDTDSFQKTPIWRRRVPPPESPLSAPAQIASNWPATSHARSRRPGTRAFPCSTLRRHRRRRPNCSLPQRRCDFRCSSKRFRGVGPGHAPSHRACRAARGDRGSQP